MCNDFLLWWLVETRLIIQESLLELLLKLGWYRIKLDVLRTWSPPINFNCLSAIFGIVTKLDEIISFALSFTMWNSDASILSTCSRSATIRVPFQTSLPRTRRIRGVFRVMLCSRIGGISIGQKQKWSDIHSNEQNEILWLNWFVEAPFLRYFSQIVAIQHGIHPPSSGQLQQLRKGSFLYSAYRYSAIPFDFER